MREVFYFHDRAAYTHVRFIEKKPGVLASGFVLRLTTPIDAVVHPSCTVVTDGSGKDLAT
jgi:hypothetical protein